MLTSSLISIHRRNEYMADIIETKRFLIREFEEGDYGDVCLLVGNEEVMRNTFSGALDGSGAREWLNRRLYEYEHPGFSLYGVIMKGAHAWVGVGGVVATEVDGRKELNMEVHLLDKYWEYGVEVAEGMKEYVFDKLGASRMVAVVRWGDMRMVDVVGRMGMLYENDTVMNGERVRVYSLKKF